MKVIEIEWADATGHSEWVNKEDALKQTMCVFKSIGYLLQKDKEKVQIATTVGTESSDVSNTLFIPRGCIKSIREIK